MKRISTIIMALVMVMTMAQCKKDSPTTPDNQNNVVTITLDVKKNNGSRVDVNTTSGTVDFETGDKVYVGSGGKYVGFLTHNGTNFVGNITNPTENQPLQFYFLGNVTPIETLSAGTTEECSVIISDQTEHLPVISCAASFENYVSGVTSYTGHLLNKCALVKFNVTTPSNSPICITGMNNKVTVDFAQNTLTPSIDGDGVIMLPAGSGENVEKWAILLPQEALEEGEEGSLYSEDDIFSGIRPAIPVIIENGYFGNGITLTIEDNGIPVGAINGLFTINNNGETVYFSQGNLQYIGSVNTPYWKFADNQWDYFGTRTGQNSLNQNVDRDLFGWGTSGWDNGNTYFQPWDTQNNGDYNSGYGYGPSSNLTNAYANADWGVYNPISNGGNQSNQWRVLTTEEWNHVFNSRITASSIRYVRAKVNNVNGVILLPDDWDPIYFSLNNTNQYNANYNSNIITALQWSFIEQHGAVFLPTAGYRDGTIVSYVGFGGHYWSSTYYDKAHAYYVYIGDSGQDPQVCNVRNGGMSVRLVLDVE